MRSITALTAALLLGAILCSAQVHIDTGARQMLASADKGFAMNAQQQSLGAVRLGKLAAEKASNPAVQQFGAQMASEHGQFNEKLTAILSHEATVLPGVMSAKDQQLYNKLNRLSGPPFDRLYLRATAKAERSAIKEYRHQAKYGKDERLRSFASESVPVLEQQLEKIRSLPTQTS